MSLKKIIIATGAAVGAMALTMGAAPSCDSTSQGDKKPVVVCRPPAGYKHAGLAAKTAKGAFYVCVDYGKTCVVTVKYPNTGDSSDIQRKYYFKSSAQLTISKNANSWSTKNCGSVYRKS